MWPVSSGRRKASNLSDAKRIYEAASAELTKAVHDKTQRQVEMKRAGTELKTAEAAHERARQVIEQAELLPLPVFRPPPILAPPSLDSIGAAPNEVDFWMLIDGAFGALGSLADRLKSYAQAQCTFPLFALVFAIWRVQRLNLKRVITNQHLR